MNETEMPLKTAYKAFIDWGDGSGQTLVNGINLDDLGQGQFEVIANHTYTTPGVYQIQVDGIDIGGGGSTSFINSFTIIVT
jgi:hypothetical protein